jgi:hypothetical protein
MKNLNELDEYRIREPAFVQRFGLGDHLTGAFYIPCPKTGSRLKVVASAGYFDWDHVSVSVNKQKRCPNWIEMCFIKHMFFEPEDAVMQLHPPQSQYVNNHAYCLHLFRPCKAEIPMPPSLLVGVKELGTLKS